MSKNNIYNTKQIPIAGRRRRRKRRKTNRLIFVCILLICAAAAGFYSLASDWNGGQWGINTVFSGHLFGREEWYLTLVNKWNPMKGDNGIEVMTLSNGEQVDSRIYPSLQDMFDDMRSEGIYPAVASGYRTEKTQQDIYDGKIMKYQAQGLSYKEARREAEKWVAVPGTSEHQLGLAVDINADKHYSASDKVYKWLDQNSWKYGFIKRYPSNKTNLTGINNEPWHYRYVGKEAARDIYNQGICLEEYLGKQG